MNKLNFYKDRENFSFVVGNFALAKKKLITVGRKEKGIHIFITCKKLRNTNTENLTSFLKETHEVVKVKDLK